MLEDCLKESELTIDRDTNKHLVVYINAIPSSAYGPCRNARPIQVIFMFES